MYTEALGTIRLEAGCALTGEKNSHEIAHFDYLCVRSVFLKSSKILLHSTLCVLKCDQKMS